MIINHFYLLMMLSSLLFLLRAFKTIERRLQSFWDHISFVLVL